MAANEKVKRRQDLLADKKTERSTFESHWQECYDYVHPAKASVTTSKTPGQKAGITVYDSTATQGSELLSGSLHGTFTNPATIFFDLTTGDDELDRKDEVRQWLQDSAMQMHAVLNGTNFQTEVHELYIDLTTPGTACLWMEEDDEDLIRFSARHIKEIYASENNKHMIDDVDRVWKWKAKQIIQEFGEEPIPAALLRDMKKEPNKEFSVVQSVFARNADVIAGKKGPKNYAFASLYFLEDHEFLLREGGYREQPFAMPRWSKISGETYGRSPTMKCLPDIRMINEMMVTTLKGAQKTIDPPLSVPHDGYILPLKTRPGGINYRKSGRSDDRIEPFGNDARIDFGIQMLNEVRQRIREAYWVDQMLLQSGPQMTATEVRQRTKEKLRLMGPVLGRQNNEFLRPVVDRLFGIMLRKNKFKPIPLVLSKANIRPKYSSIIAREQRMSELDNLMQAINVITPMLQMWPGGADLLNGDEAVRHIASITGLPQRLIRGSVEIEKIRRGKAEAEQAALDSSRAMEQAEIMKKTGPVALAAAKEGVMVG